MDSDDAGAGNITTDSDACNSAPTNATTHHVTASNATYTVTNDDNNGDDNSEVIGRRSANTKVAIGAGIAFAVLIVASIVTPNPYDGFLILPIIISMVTVWLALSWNAMHRNKFSPLPSPSSQSLAYLPAPA